jgi:hypothetical protein
MRNIFAYVNGNPLSGVDPIGLWETSVHTQAADEVFGRELGEDGLVEVVAAQYFIDSKPFQVPGYSYVHAMSDASQNPPEACAMTERFVRERFAMAWAARATGDMRGALWNFAYALHALQDSTSPSHSGFKVWNANPWWHPETVMHWLPESINPGPKSSLYRITREAWTWFKSGNIPSTAIFDCSCK